MPARGLKFINQFLVPSLDSKKFGSRLKWIDPQHGVFQLQWCHKSASFWTSNDAEVFIEWDKIKGHYKPENREYYTKSKQRFRAILYKMIGGKYIKEMSSKDKNTRLYRIDYEKCVTSTVFPVSSNERENSNNFTFEDVYDKKRIHDFESSPSEHSVAENQHIINGDHRYINEEPLQTDAKMIPLSDIPPNNNVNGSTEHLNKTSEDTGKSTSFGTTESENQRVFFDSGCTNVELFVVPQMNCLEENFFSLQPGILTPPEMDTSILADPTLFPEWGEQRMALWS